jgi:hypothetical protein
MQTIGTAIEDGIEGIKSLAGNPYVAAAGGAVAGAALLGAGIGIASAVKKKRKSSSKKKRAPVRKKRSKTRKYARTAGKRKDTSTRRIRMTKNGQPYVILASGKARFISKKSAKSSRKRKGGRY